MKHLIWILIGVCVLNACKEHTGYVINGVVNGADGQKVILQVIENLEPVVKDSAVIKKGKFEMKGNVECPEFAMLTVAGNGPIQFFIENSTIDVSVNMDSIAASKVTGSKENDIFVSFNTLMERFNKQIKPLNDEYMSLKLSGEEDAEKEKRILSQMDQIREERINVMSDFVVKYPNTVVSAFIIDNMLSRYMAPEKIQPIADSFDETLNKSQWVKLLKENLETATRTQEGRLFSDITLKTPDDAPISISDYAGKGKYVLIDFWASWCRPCRMANPHVVTLYEKYKDKGFEIIGISLDKDKSEWIAAIEDDKLTWPQMSDLKFWQSDAAKLYSVNSIPYTILLDQEGKILAKNLGHEELEKKLSELLK